MQETSAAPAEEKTEKTPSGKKWIRVLALILAGLCLTASGWFLRQGILAGREADLAAHQAQALEKMVNLTAQQLPLLFHGDEAAENRVRSALEPLLEKDVQEDSSGVTEASGGKS